MLKQPITLGPYKILYKTFSELEGEKVYAVVIGTENPDSPYPVLVEVISDDDPSPEDVHAQITDAEFILQAITLLPEAIALLESIEAQSEDKAACRKIREFLKEKEIW